MRINDEKITEGLKALKNIKEEAGTPYFSSLYDINDWRKDFDTVGRYLKAFEIIDRKNIDVGLLKMLMQMRGDSGAEKIVNYYNSRLNAEVQHAQFQPHRIYLEISDYEFLEPLLFSYL